jgi:site-specific DNA recombinase
MNALFLKDLAEKTHRGLRGRVESGKAGGGLCYGYRVVKSLVGGTLTTGEREIEPVEAAIVDRIFREYVVGIAPKAIAKRLNHDGIAGPLGGTWSPSTIHGNSRRGTGILNNELYIGRLIWNRLRYVKNPDTGADARPRRRDASDRVEGEPGGHAGSHRTNEEVAGIRRPLPASIFGCGGGI